MIVALLTVKTVNLTEWAQVFLTQANPDSAYMRIKRFFRYEMNCFTLWYRRLEKGRFIFARDAEGCIEMSREQLSDEVEVKSHIRKKHPIRRPLPDYLPREVVMHDIPEAEKVCGCGEHLVRIDEETSEQLKYIPAQIYVIKHVRPKYACKPCQENVKIATMPALLLPKSIRDAAKSEIQRLSSLPFWKSYKASAKIESIQEALKSNNENLIRAALGERRIPSIVGFLGDAPPPASQDHTVNMNMRKKN